MENYPTTQPIAVVDRQRPYTPKSWWLLVQIALDSVAWIIGLVIAFYAAVQPASEPELCL